MNDRITLAKAKPGTLDFGSVGNGIFAPAGTPAAVIERINAEVNRALANPTVRQRFESPGAEPGGGSACAFATYVREEVDRWGKVIRAAGVRLQ